MKTILLAAVAFALVAAGARAFEVAVSRDRAIVLEEFAVRDLPLDQVLEKLAEASIKADPDKAGVGIVNFTKEPLRSRKVTINVRKTSVRSILELLAGTIGLSVHWDGSNVQVRNSEHTVKGKQP